MTIGLLSFGRPFVATTGLVFNFVYDSNWSGAPASYQTALNSAAAALSAAFPNTNATLNIEVGFGQLENTLAVGANSSVGIVTSSAFLSYSTIRAAMVTNNKTTAMNTLLTNTPAGSTLNGTGSFFVNTACQKVLGLNGLSPTDPGLDGAIGIGSGWSTGELVGMLLHELTHTMGRVQQNAPFVFSRFTAVGTRDFNNNTANTYFSLDGGSTHVANYDGSSDVSDFLNSSVQDGNSSATWDPLDAFQGSQSIQSLTTADLEIMNTLGFQ